MNYPALLREDGECITEFIHVPRLVGSFIIVHLSNDRLYKFRFDTLSAEATEIPDSARQLTR
jgi:hypothetical protein